MLLFTLAITIPGMYKFRAVLESQLSVQRYFYFGSAFALWFICCIFDKPYLRTCLLDWLRWQGCCCCRWSRRSLGSPGTWNGRSGRAASPAVRPAIIPASPPGLYFSFSAAADGPLARSRLG
jgi:hypothetical protein